MTLPLELLLLNTRLDEANAKRSERINHYSQDLKKSTTARTEESLLSLLTAVERTIGSTYQL